MAKARSKLADFAVYVAFRVSVCIMQALPPGVALWVLETVAEIYFRVDRRRREITIDNLRQAFPGRYNDRELQELARKVYRHFAAGILETALMQRKVTPTTSDRYVDAREVAPVLARIKAGQPVIILTAHFGNWELSAHCLAHAGVRSHLVARAIDNPYIDRWLRAWREATGHKVLSKTGDVRRMADALKAGETICTLGDQDAGANGMFVEFFGLPASTHKAIARLAERTGALIAVVALQKTGGLLEYAIRVSDVIHPEEHEGDADATHAITQRFTSAIEAIIRLDPSQYFWLHRRWKHQPPTATRAAA